jgi:FkbM family methyltransferase
MFIVVREKALNGFLPKDKIFLLGEVMDRNGILTFTNNSDQNQLFMLTEEQMKALVVQYRPKLLTAISNSDFIAATDEIRQFASMSLLWNQDGISFLENVDPLKQELSASQFYFYFISGELAVNDMGASAYLASLYRLFNFYSGWYRAGVPSYLDHAFCVVAVPVKGSSLDLIIQDPLLQTGFKIQENGSRNLVQIFERLEEQGAEGIEFTVGDTFLLKHLSTTGDNRGFKSYLSENRFFISESEQSFSFKHPEEKFASFIQLLPDIVNRPVENCGITDCIRFAITSPETGESALDTQIATLFSEMRVRLQRKFDPSNVGFKLEDSQPHEAKKEINVLEGEGWTKLDNGYSVRTVAYPNEDGYVEITQAHKESRKKYGISENAIEVSELEVYATVEALMACAGRTAYMLELGSGFGKGCLDAASLVNRQRITPYPSKLEVAAIEAEPNHFKWTRETLKSQGLGDKIYFGAVSGYNGHTRFLISPDSPQNQYGQSMKPNGNFVVPTYTLDTLFRKTGFPKLDILHLDIQGAETEVLWQARDILADGLIDYIILGTHGNQIEKDLRGILAPTHELLIAVDSFEEVFFPTLNASYAATVDGFQFYRRWGVKQD